MLEIHILWICFRYLPKKLSSSKRIPKGLHNLMDGSTLALNLWKSQRAKTSRKRSHSWSKIQIDHATWTTWMTGTIFWTHWIWCPSMMRIMAVKEQLFWYPRTLWSEISLWRPPPSRPYIIEFSMSFNVLTERKNKTVPISLLFSDFMGCM